MSLNIPYPDLDFVPLDVLTAEEMNMIVANYTFVSEQFPVKSSNIDWTTMPMRAKTLDGNSQLTKIKITLGSRVEQYTCFTGHIYTRYNLPIGYRLQVGSTGDVDNLVLSYTPSGWTWTKSGKTLTIETGQPWSQFGIDWLVATGKEEILINRV